ncbi:MAG: PKD domain-containing protein [Solirubrobacteraceae bacterium]
MRTPIRYGALGLLLGAVLVLGLDGAAHAAGVADARITTSYVMHGQVITALRVRGEHRGQSVTRRWTFTGTSCAGSVCQRLALRRQRSANHYDRLTLSRVGIGSYAGSGRFYSALTCRGRRYPRGLVVPYRIAVQVSQVAPVEDLAFASQITATYVNLHRVDRTRCPVGPSHDAAQYLGAAAPVPGPPVAGLSVVEHPAADSATFSDTSAPGAGGARIVARQWQFGDPASGPANTATTPQAEHAFSAPGSYQVSLSVTDADGLTATATRTVVAPGPPTAAFTALPLGPPLTYAFHDASQPGIGGAAVVAWQWSFGDAPSPSNLSSLRNPRHAFSTPGTYQVCLIVTDANRRQGRNCAVVVVSASEPTGAALTRQASKRTVARTALSSPIS